MGRTSKDKSELTQQGNLFPDEAAVRSTARRASLLHPGRTPFDHRQPPIHTNLKSRLIAEYISRYQYVTHGGLFIDGFSGPQKLQFREAWTARRVLELEPKWIRHFWLCEIDPAGLSALRDLKSEHHGRPRSRSVSVMAGDFNEAIKMILKSPKLRRSTPMFVLLDQRTAECHWASVQAIAARAGRRKIEFLYFLGVGWLLRSLATSTTEERQRELDLWWGGSGWRGLIGSDQTRLVKAVCDRFASEFGYEHVTPWPVFKDEEGKRKMFYLIHASDHPKAPHLMRQAYVHVMGHRAGTPADAQLQLPNV